MASDNATATREIPLVGHSDAGSRTQFLGRILRPVIYCADLPDGSRENIARMSETHMSDETTTNPAAPRLELLSLVIPARDEAGCIGETVSSLILELRRNNIPHEVVVVVDRSVDETWSILQKLQNTFAELRPIANFNSIGFGRAIVRGFDEMKGDAVVIMMADASDDPEDVVRYWKHLNLGYDCVFGSRFVEGGRVIGYPRLKLAVNRVANLLVMFLLNIRLNDTTNAFKAYRKTVIDGCRPLVAPHFNLTVELPLKAIVRGFSSTIIPVTWRNRRVGVGKLKIKEMGSRYFFMCAYVWLEKHFSCGDYLRPHPEANRTVSTIQTDSDSENHVEQLLPR